MPISERPRFWPAYLMKLISVFYLDKYLERERTSLKISSLKSSSFPVHSTVADREIAKWRSVEGKAQEREREREGEREREREGERERERLKTFEWREKISS